MATLETMKMLAPIVTSIVGAIWRKANNPRSGPTVAYDMRIVAYAMIALACAMIAVAYAMIVVAYAMIALAIAGLVGLNIWAKQLAEQSIQKTKRTYKKQEEKTKRAYKKQEEKTKRACKRDSSSQD